MFENVQKKLMNFYILADLGKMSHRIPKNFSHVMHLQNERVFSCSGDQWIAGTAAVKS